MRSSYGLQFAGDSVAMLDRIAAQIVLRRREHRRRLLDIQWVAADRERRDAMPAFQQPAQQNVVPSRGRASERKRRFDHHDYNAQRLHADCSPSSTILAAMSSQLYARIVAERASAAFLKNSGFACHRRSRAARLGASSGFAINRSASSRGYRSATPAFADTIAGSPQHSASCTASPYGSYRGGASSASHARITSGTSLRKPRK